jgi:hypothetical protein
MASENTDSYRFTVRKEVVFWHVGVWRPGHRIERALDGRPLESFGFKWSIFRLTRGGAERWARRQIRNDKRRSWHVFEVAA